jgi:hypothetical protein
MGKSKWRPDAAPADRSMLRACYVLYHMLHAPTHMRSHHVQGTTFKLVTYPTCMLKSYTCAYSMARYALDGFHGYAVRGTLVRNTTQAPWSHLCTTHASKAYLGPRTRGVNCSRYAPQHPPLDTAENACHSRDGRDNHGERKSIHAGGCTRLRKQWPERGPHAGESFVRTPCRIPSVAP